MEGVSDREPFTMIEGLSRSILIAILVCLPLISQYEKGIFRLL